MKKKLLAATLLAATAFVVRAPAVHAYREWNRRAKVKALLAAPPNSLEVLPLERDPDGEILPDGVERDDPALRTLARRAWAGDPTDEVRRQWGQIAADEAKRWAPMLPAARKGRAAFSAESWVSLGPEDADSEWNGTSYTANDTGRPTAIVLDPRDPEVVYLATAGGGVWKTYDFVTKAPSPDWLPITEALGQLAIGALVLDPTNPDVVYVGTGDAFDQKGNAVYKSVDGGGTWTGPVMLTAQYPAASGSFTRDVRSVRELAVDPANPQSVFAATDVGLLHSTDGGSTFTTVDLPNAGAAQTSESTWNVKYLGPGAGGSVFVVSGVAACDTAWPPPGPGGGVIAGGMSYVRDGINGEKCKYGNPGDIWRSGDGGATWTSARATTGVLPVFDLSRIQLAVGDTSNAAKTAIYAYCENMDEGSSKTIAFLRSIDGGLTYANATGTLSNPTSLSFGGRDCGDMNLGHAQSWYNLAIAVDPSNPDNVVAGGNLCGIRTTNGTSGAVKWENVSHWLPSGGGGNVTGGKLPYVHADWHAITIGPNGKAFAGSDGGLFSSANLFTAGVSPPQVAWAWHNKGVVTHLFYGIASGDPADGDQQIVFGGLQDNGTRFRSSDPKKPTTFNQVIGGDGIGVAVSKGTSGKFFWGSVAGGHLYCNPGTDQCDKGGYWTNSDPTIGVDDSQPFLIHYYPVTTDPTGTAVLTHTDHAVWKSTSSFGWTKLGPTYPADRYVRNVYSSPTIPKLYGAMLNAGLFAVTTDEATWTITATQLGTGPAKNQMMRYTSAMAFPLTTPAGKNPGDVFVVTSAAPVMEDLSPVPAAIGHIFITQNKGTSWTPIHGNGTGFDLPNVPINVLRVDPGDPTSNTMFVGTDLGVYRTQDGGQTWKRYGYGLPLVKVEDMFLAKNQSLLRIATYGRGLWEIYPSATASRGASGDGDFDRDLGIDFIDLAAMASRLGTNPSTTGWPGYLWIDDMTAGATSPPVSAIDEDDLAALLARFGDHP